MIRTWTEAELIDMEQIAEHSMEYADESTIEYKTGRALSACVGHIRKLNERISDLESRLVVDEELSRG